MKDSLFLRKNQACALDPCRPRLRQRPTQDYQFLGSDIRGARQDQPQAELLLVGEGARGRVLGGAGGRHLERNDQAGGGQGGHAGRRRLRQLLRENAGGQLHFRPRPPALRLHVPEAQGSVPGCAVCRPLHPNCVLFSNYEVFNIRPPLSGRYSTSSTGAPSTTRTTTRSTTMACSS